MMVRSWVLGGMFLMVLAGSVCAGEPAKPFVPGVTPEGRPVALWLEKPTRADIASIAEVCREAVVAVLQRRPQKTPEGVSGNSLLADNGISLAVFKGGKMLATGSGIGQKLPENARVASGEAVYGLQLEGIDSAQVVVSILGKPEVQPMGTAPFYKYKPGSEGYRASYKGKSAVVGPVECVIGNWTWKEVLLRLARAVAPERAKDYSTKELIGMLATPDFALSVMPARTIISPAAGQPAEVLNLSTDASAMVIDRSTCEDCFMLAVDWLGQNQSPTGQYPGAVDLVSGKQKAPADAYASALAAYALGQAWKVKKNDAQRVQGVRALDNLFISFYLDSPGQDFGYLKENNEVSLASSAMTLLAVDALDAAQGNQQISRIRQRLLKFMQVMHQGKGLFRPWFYPANRKSQQRLFSAMGSYTLLKVAPKTYAGKFTGLFTVLTPQEIEKAPLTTGWMLLAACEEYAATRQSRASGWAFKTAQMLAVQNSTILKEAKGKGLLAQVCGLLLQAYSEVLYLQKLQMGTGRGEESRRLALLRKAALECLSELVSLQIRRGAKSLLLKSPKAAVGAFCRSAGDMECSLPGNAHAVLGLSRALEVLEDSDFAAGK